MQKIKIFLSSILTGEEQKLLLFIFFFAFIGMLIHSTGLIANDSSEAIDSLAVIPDEEIKYDLNNITAQELMNIPGIGEKRAADIISYGQNTGFKSRSDLLNIKGIGETSFKKIKKWFIEFENEKEKNDLEDTGFKVNSETSFKIDLNSASIDDLCKLKGIGPSKAEKILAMRKELGGFSAIDQLLNVKGIGVKTLEKIKKDIQIGE